MRPSMLFSRRILPLLLLLSAFAARPISAQGSTPTVEALCTKGSWSDCGVAVKQSIAALPDPLPADKIKRLFEIMTLWSDAYEKQLRFLESGGRIKRSESDWTKIKGVIEDALNPVEIAKEKIAEAFLKKYLPRAAPFLFYAKTVYDSIEAFFKLLVSDTATDLDQLDLMNRDLQNRFFNKMEPHLRSDWRTRLETLSTKAMPQLKAK